MPNAKRGQVIAEVMPGTTLTWFASDIVIDGKRIVHAGRYLIAIDADATDA